MHMVIKAYCLFCSCNSNAAEYAILAPVTPNGCPIAIEPPFGFNLGSLSANPHARVHAKAWAAKASLSSITSYHSWLILLFLRPYWTPELDLFP